MLRSIAGLGATFALISICLPTTSSGEDGITPNFKETGLKDGCSHIRILDPDTPGDSFKVPKDLRYFKTKLQKGKLNLHKAGPNQRKLITQALNSLPKFVCSAVRMVVIYRSLPPKEERFDPNKRKKVQLPVRVEGKMLSDSADAFVLDSYPNLINIMLHSIGENELAPSENESGRYSKEWPIGISRIIHEAYHCAQYLLDLNEHHAFLDSLPVKRDGPKFWPAPVNKKAKKIMLKARLDKEGFTEKWTELHRDSIKITDGPDYQKGDLEEGEEVITMDRKVAPSLGFFTHYARSRPGEDIAETASWVVGDSIIFNAEYSEVESWIRPCEIVKNSIKNGVLTKQAIVFAKLAFLADVELISATDFKNCIGTSEKGINNLDGKKTGFHFYRYHNGQYVKSYTEGFSITRTSEGYLRIKAKGSIDKGGQKLDSFLELQFRTKEEELPRGLYKMSWAGNQNNPGPKFAVCNHLYPLRIPPDANFAYSQQVPGDKSQSYCAIEARVLVSNATEDHIELSMILFKVARTTPIRKVPGVFDPPIQIIVRWKRNWNEEQPDDGPPTV